TKSQNSTHSLHDALPISDDGGGLDIDRIREKAIEKGLTQPGKTLSEAEIADFIFHAGVSTATEVSRLAGRGVGMDVVRTEVAALDRKSTRLNSSHDQMSY